jgi:hypothetical protein
MSDDTLNPKFGDIIENGLAGDVNPHRVGIFVRTGYRKGRMNPGKYFVMTDGKGEFYELVAANDRLTVIGNIATEANAKIARYEAALEKIRGLQIEGGKESLIYLLRRVRTEAREALNSPDSSTRREMGEQG